MQYFLRGFSSGSLPQTKPLQQSSSSSHSTGSSFSFKHAGAAPTGVALGGEAGVTLSSLTASLLLAQAPSNSTTANPTQAATPELVRTPIVCLVIMG